MTDENQKRELVAQVQLSEDELLRLVGSDLMGKRAFPASHAQLIERANRWMDAQRIAFQRAICSNVGIRELVQDKNDTLSIASEILQILVGLALPVNPVSLAVLLAKKGTKALCISYWEKQ
jgi:hypothetical protein